MGRNLRELATPPMRRLASAFVLVLERAGYGVRVTSVRRDPDEQRRLYERSLRGLNPYPVALPGHSLHERGWAFDLQLDPPDYDGPGRLWESLGLRWGGEFDDPIHFDFAPRGFTG